MRKLALAGAVAVSAVSIALGVGAAEAAALDSSSTNVAQTRKSVPSHEASLKGISPGCDGGLHNKPWFITKLHDHYYGNSSSTACQQCDAWAVYLAEWGWKYTWCAEFGNNEIAELWYGDDPALAQRMPVRR